MKHYYVLTQDPLYRHVLAFIKTHGLRCDLHLNRTRFWVPNGAVKTELLLRFPNIATVDEALDLATGLPLVHDNK